MTAIAQARERYGTLEMRRDPLNGRLQYRQPTPVLADGMAWFDLDEIPDLGEMIRAGGVTPEALHAACFVGHLVLALDVATPDEVLGDYGLVHEIAHGLSFGVAADDPDATMGGSPCSLNREKLAALADDLTRKLHSVVSGVNGRI